MSTTRKTVVVCLAPLVLGALAVVLLLLSNDLSTAAGTAGFALAGAAVVRFLDERSKVAEEREAREAQRRRDLDETRRMIYMALATMHGSIGGSIEAAGTVANALAHHYRKFTVEEATELAQAIHSGPSRTSTIKTLQDVVREITKELGEPVEPPPGES